MLLPWLNVGSCLHMVVFLGRLPYSMATSFKRNGGFNQYSSSLFYVMSCHVMLSPFNTPAMNELTHMASAVLAYTYTQQLIFKLILSLQLSNSFYIKTSLKLLVLCAFSQFSLLFVRLNTCKRYVNTSPGSQLAASAQGSTVTSLGLQRKMPDSSDAEMLWSGERQQ